MLYHRINSKTFFLIPTIAVGIEIDGRYFFEIAWFNVAIGIGNV